MSKFTRREMLGASALAGVAITTGAAIAAHHEGENLPGLSGKRVLITGTSSGFGRRAAELFARAGATVIATMRNLPRPEADELVALVASDDLDIHVVEIDVLSNDSVESGVAEGIRLAGGPIDILINNAGIGIGTTVELQDMEAAELITQTNLLGYHRLIRAVLPGMRSQGSGLIFQVSSQLGRVIVPGYGLYSATKFAVEAHSEQLAYEVAPHGIEVCVIQPGGFPTEIWKNTNRYTAALLERASEERKAGYPAFVANAMQADRGTSPDPMMVPQAMLEIAAMPAGTRPLRRPVHPNFIPQAEVNAISRKAQIAFLGRTPYAPMVEAVLGA